MVTVFGSTQKGILKVLECEHELYKSFNEVYSQRKNRIMSNSDKEGSELWIQHSFFTEKRRNS